VCRDVSCVFLDNPTLTRAEFLETLASRFDLGGNALKSKASLLGALESVIRGRHSRREITALVIDEAQALPDEILEEIRLLANMETPTQKLLPVVLAGQPELSERLNEPGLRQLKQRIALRCELKPLDLADTAAYIASRIRTAGGDPANIFTRQAVTLIHEHSHGIPRTISVICDNALVSGFALDQRPVDGDIVLEVCRDFDLKKAPAAAPAAAAVIPAPPVQKTPHLALVTAEVAEPESAASGPVVAVDNTNGRQHHQAVEEQREAAEPRREALELRSGSMLGLR